MPSSLRPAWTKTHRERLLDSPLFPASNSSTGRVAHLDRCAASERAHPMCVPTKLSLFASKPAERSSLIRENFQSAGKMLRKNLKGRDIGYALAASCCETASDAE